MNLLIKKLSEALCRYFVTHHQTIMGPVLKNDIFLNYTFKIIAKDKTSSLVKQTKKNVSQALLKLISPFVFPAGFACRTRIMQSHARREVNESSYVIFLKWYLCPDCFN
jgi:hypothetical protein